MEMKQVEMFDTDKVKFKDKVRNIFRLGKKTVENNKDNIKAAGETVKGTAEKVYKAEATRAFGTAMKDTIVDAIRSEEFRIMVVWIFLMSLLGGWLIGAWHLGAIIGSVIGLAKILSPR